MSRGSVSISTENKGQGEIASVERFAVFIGVAPENAGIYQRVNQTTDLDQWLGNADSDLKTQLTAAKNNAGQDWAAGCVVVAGNGANQAENDAEILAAIDEAMKRTNAEFIAVCVPRTQQEQIQQLFVKAIEIYNSLARPVIIVAAAPGIDTGSQTWADYETQIQALQAGFAGYRVGYVPQLHGNNLGVVMGRACNSAVSIADSIMRTATGPAIGLGPTPIDSTGAELQESNLGTLESYRAVVPQTYPDFDGIYFSDFNLLDTQIGDYKVAEHLRAVDKAARRVRALLLPKVANRNLNSTPVSMAYHVNYLRQPLDQMAQKVVVNGEEIVGDIRPPSDDAIVLEWVGREELVCYVTVQPYNSPKIITARVGVLLNTL